MKFAISSLAAVAAALVISASPATSAETKTWYVYCEGNRQGDHWAVFSENFWPHPLTESYGREVGSAAKAFFESRHDVELEGCAAVNFVEPSLAQHSRSRTEQLHRRMGDRVYYFPLPSEALPAYYPVRPVKPSADLSTASDPAPEPAVRAGEPRPVMSPRRADR